MPRQVVGPPPNLQGKFVTNSSFTGARGVFKLDGKEVGFCTGCDGNEQIMRQALRVLGSVYVAEHVPVAYDMAFSASFARLINNSLKSIGLWPKHMPSSEEFLREILAFSDLTATLYDPISQTNIYKNQRVVPVSLSWNLDPQGLAIQRCVFAGQKQLEESEG